MKKVLSLILILSIITLTAPHAFASEEWFSCTDFSSHSFDFVTGDVTFEFDVTPHKNAQDGVIGFSALSTVSYWTSFDIIFNLTSGGTFAARNGTGVEALNVVGYEKDKTYHVVITSDTVKKTFSAFVDGVCIASEFAFRTDGPSLCGFDKVCVMAGYGYEGALFSVTNLSASQSVTAAQEVPIAINFPKTQHAVRDFIHPGVLHTESDFKRIRAMLSLKKEPYLSGWNALLSNSLSSPAAARAVSVVNRGSAGDNIALLYTDIARAYQCALRWKIEGSVEHANAARDILNAWSATLTSIGGTADRYLAAGLYGYQAANAAELLRGYEGFDTERMQNMLLNVFYKPLCERFLISNEYGDDHNGANIYNYWANWDLCNMAATLAIGVFCDRRDIYDIGIEYFKNGDGNGAIYNAIPYIHGETLGQVQESGRDQGHATLALGLLAEVCQIAWNQGDDLYSWADSRVLRGAEYIARYNNGYDDVPFAYYEWQSGTSGTLQSHSVISNISRGAKRAVWAMLYNHYATQKGLDAPNSLECALSISPEGGAANGGHASGFDLPGFGTLLYTIDAPLSTDAAMPDGNIADGVYSLTALHSLKAMCASKSGVIQLSGEDDEAQRWIVIHQGGGQYAIINAQSRLALTVENSAFDNGAAIILDNYSGALNQRFAFIPAQEGTYRIAAAHSGKSVGVSTRSLENGALIRQWRYEFSPHQMWTLCEIKGGASLSITYDKNVFEHGSKKYLKRGESYTLNLNSDSIVTAAQNADYTPTTRTLCPQNDGAIEFCVSDSYTTRTFFEEYIVADSAEDILNALLSYNAQKNYTAQSLEAFLPLYRAATAADITSESFNPLMEELLAADSALVCLDGYMETPLGKTLDITRLAAISSANGDDGNILCEKLLDSDITTAPSLRSNTSGGGFLTFDFGKDYAIALEGVRLYALSEATLYASNDGFEWVSILKGTANAWASALSCGEYRFLRLYGSAAEVRLEGAVIEKASAFPSRVFSDVSFAAHKFDAQYSSLGVFEFDITPFSDNCRDGIVALCPASLSPDAWSDYAIYLRLFSGGYFEAYNGGYTYSNKIAYKKGVTYKAKIVTHIAKGTYDIYINDMLMAKDFAYRSSAASIGKFSVLSGSGRDRGDFCIDNMKAFAHDYCTILSGTSAFVYSTSPASALLFDASYSGKSLSRIKAYPLTLTEDGRCETVLESAAQRSVYLWNGALVPLTR